MGTLVFDKRLQHIAANQDDPAKEKLLRVTGKFREWLQQMALHDAECGLTSEPGWLHESELVQFALITQVERRC